MTTTTRQRRAVVAGIGLLALSIRMSGLAAPQATPPTAALFAALDTNKDTVVTRAEMRAAFSGWFASWAGNKAGALTQAAIAAGLGQTLGIPSTAGTADGRTPRESDVQEMLKVLPSAAPARPARPRRVLVLADSPGFTHSSIPLAARTVEELGRKTGAWSTTVSYDPNVVTVENLKPYDAIVLDSTVGAFLDEAGDQAVTDARRAAFLAFVRGGKGLVGIHAATDTYHSGSGNTPFTRAAPVPAQMAAAIVTLADKDADRKLTAAELAAFIDIWFEAMDIEKTGRISATVFAEGFTAIGRTAGLWGLEARSGGRGGGVAAGRGSAPSGALRQGSGRPEPESRGATWPEFNRMVGGIFKSHPWQGVPIKIEHDGSPLTAMFANRSFEFQDEIYTFFQDSWSRTNVRVLMSIDYAKISDADKAREANASARTDGDYGLSWIRRDGSGRVFYFALGHREDGIYRSTEMLRHLLAGMQYAIGDLKADDSPSSK